MRFMADVALETLWPTQCALCNRPGQVLCEHCRAQLPWMDLCRSCPACGAPYGTRLCTECNTFTLATLERDHLPLDGFASSLLLTDDARSLVTIYKDKDERRLGEEIAAIMARYVDPEWLRYPLTLTYIPDTKAALRKRGFDHGEELGCILARMLDLEVARAFARPCATDQRILGRSQRFKNMEGKLVVREDADISEHVLLIDDICTTGATLYSACDALRLHGAKKVFAITFARAVD